MGFNGIGQNKSLKRFIPFVNDSIENRFTPTLSFDISIQNSLSKKIKNVKTDVYLNDVKSRTIKSTKKGKILFDLYLQNSYKIIIYADNYQSKVYLVDTKMTKKDQEEFKYGGDFIMEIKLDNKTNQDSGNEALFIIYYDTDIGYFNAKNAR